MNPSTAATTTGPGPGPKPRSTGILILIGASKLATGLLLAAAGFGIFRMLHLETGQSVEAFIKRLRLDPENWVVHDALSRVTSLDRAQMKALGLGTFFYAILELIEGTGLLLRKRWAEYLTVLATGLLLIPEGYEIAAKVNAVRVTVMLLNVVVLVYLIIKLREKQAEPAETA